jgi:hypothetical protein
MGSLFKRIGRHVGSFCIWMLLVALGAKLVAQPPVADPGGQNPSASVEQEQWGIAQVDGLLKDRPQLGAVIAKGDPVYQWLVQDFAAPDLSYKIAWKNAPTDLDLASYAQSSAYPPKPGGPSYIRVDGAYDKEKGTQLRPVDEVLSDLIFELHNVRHADEKSKLDCEALFQTISRDDFIKSCAHIEFDAESETAKVYSEIWRNYASAHAIPNLPRRWCHHGDEDFATYLARVPRSFWYPWKFYGDRFDACARAGGKGLLAKADSGDVEAEERVGQTYYETSDFADAANWLSKAALKKNLSAMAILSWMYTKGEGMPKNGEKGFNLALQAAELGGPYSQEYVGSHFFSNGDYSNAAEWYFKAAKQGNVVAEREMSWMYDHGRGVAADEREAFAWALKAAQQGDHAAMRAIAHRYENGNGVAANAVEAKMWTSKLASAESESVKTP